LNPVAALCVLSIAGAVQVTVRLLPVPCASDAALGVFGTCGVGVGGGEFDCPRPYIVPWGRFARRGVEEYLAIFAAVPVGVACMWWLGCRCPDVS
jgi:hypothetical protein